MSMNRQSGNMYPWVTHTWNPIKGRCPHHCKYCYMKKFKVGELRLDEKCLEDDLGEGNTIFVGSSTDMFANAIPQEWIDRVLNYCSGFPRNTYLFQSKNPERFKGLSFPKNTIFGTTIESNLAIDVGIAPDPIIRVLHMATLSGRKMVSIEPIMDFDLFDMVSWMGKIKPEFVSIGADSKTFKLSEPSSEKLKTLIEELEKFTDVRIKDNLSRLMV